MALFEFGGLVLSQPVVGEQARQGVLNVGALCEHGGPVDSPDIVEVEIERQAGRWEDEHVQRCSPGKRQAATQVGVGGDLVGESQQPHRLFEPVRNKPRSIGQVFEFPSGGWC